MYTNIDTNLGISTIRDNSDRIPRNFPVSMFLNILEVIMKNNIFNFASTFWQQLSGTTMGTPVACNCATVTYGHFENTVVIPRFKSNLYYYKNYIDDIFGIWIPPPTNQLTTWTNFKNTLNQWGLLEWLTEEPSKQTNFLDLTIHPQQNKITTSTYQKELNLYLYIPPLSAHPLSCFKGLINGEIFRYWTHNSPHNFVNLLSKFIERLVQWGHSIEKLTPLLQQAAQKLEFKNHLTKDTTNNRTLYIHWVYDSKDISNRDLRDLYNATIQPHTSFDKMIIALSRPKNLRDMPTRSRLALPEGLNLRDIINQCKKTFKTKNR
jgi:hypothetical protein